MPPLFGGGDMIRKVTLTGATYADAPHRFEAGTPPITSLVGMAEAVRFIEEIGFDVIEAREAHLTAHLLDRLGHVDGVTIHGFPRHRAPIVSFSVEGAHPHDVVTLLDADGLALRGGHHCAQPLMESLGVPATTRASLAFYNTDEEIERLGVALTRLARMFA